MRLQFKPQCVHRRCEIVCVAGLSACAIIDLRQQVQELGVRCQCHEIGAARGGAFERKIKSDDLEAIIDLLAQCVDGGGESWCGLRMREPQNLVEYPVEFGKAFAHAGVVAHVEGEVCLVNLEVVPERQGGFHTLAVTEE